MSKRLISPQQNCDRKKAKLDISDSDHNFLLSQNSISNKDVDQSDNWGDDNENEMLLLASQFCEEAFKDPNLSILPNYSMCMQPSSTSTQIDQLQPSSSSSSHYFFKKPVSSMVSTKGNDKYERISSPLPGLSKVCKSGGAIVSDDLIINDKYKGQNLDNIYCQLQKLQEENKKLKTDNIKLLENCMTKEGEASILRTQLKNCQATADNARLEKLKVQEKAQVEWSDKLTAANKQLDDLRTQLEFKNTEILSMKQKCKVLGLQKVGLTQVMVPTNDISMSQRHNNSMHLNNDSKIISRKVKTASNSVQTDDKSYFLKLNIPQREESSELCEILPLIMEPTENQFSILDYNEKLKLQTNIQNKCHIFNTFHRLPTTVCASKGTRRKNIDLKCIYVDLSYIATCKGKYLEQYINISKLVKEVIHDVQAELDTVHQRMTTAFQKEMNEKYHDMTSKMLTVDRRDLLCGRALYKEEQALLARRLTAILAYILEYSTQKNVIIHLLEQGDSNVAQTHSIIKDINRICSLLEKTSCAILYSGLLLSITHLIEVIHKHTDKQSILQIMKTIISSRPMPFVSCHLVKLLTSVCTTIEHFRQFCININEDSNSMDYDQDPCMLQILLKQIEVAFKCIGKQQMLKQAVTNTQYLILLHSRLNPPNCSDSQVQSCSCQLVLIQVLVYALQISNSILSSQDCVEDVAAALAARGAGAAARAAELGAADGRLLLLCQRAPGNTLSEITRTLLTVEEKSQSYSTKAWLGALDTLSIAD